jgi:hypothetical protein
MQTVSQDVTVTDAGVATVHGAHVPAGDTKPEFGQAQAASGAGQRMRIRSQAAATGSTTNGGDISFVVGKIDGAIGADGPFFLFGEALSTDPTQINERGPTNYFGYMSLARTSNGVIGLGLGEGTGNGAGVNAIEISSVCPISIATETLIASGSPINISPISGAGPRATYYFYSQKDGSPLFTVGSNSGINTGLQGVFSLDWMNSGFHHDLFDQRDSTNSIDLPILSRWGGTLVFGSFTENPAIWGQNAVVVRLLQTGNGFEVVNQNPVSNGTQTQFSVASDNQASVVQGDVLGGANDAVIAQIYPANTTATTANQVIATIPLRSGTQAADYLEIIIVGRCPSTGDMASFDLRALFANNGGAVTQVGTTTTVASQYTSGAGASINPTLAISGGNVLVEVTPWTATATHWTVFPVQRVNMAAATAPAAPTPPGSPITWLNADAQAVGAVNPWTDQSGNSNNWSVPGGASAPTNTANAGPGGTRRAVLFTGSAPDVLKILSTLSLGTTNFTLALIAKVNSIGTGQKLIQTGFSVALSIGIDGHGHRQILYPSGSGVATLAGAGTTNWESWVYSSDSLGNQTLLINGIPQGLSVYNESVPASIAQITIGADLSFGGPLTGAIYDVLIYNTAQDPHAVYAYHHAKAGL